MQSVLRPERELEHRRERVSVEARSSSRAAAASDEADEGVVATMAEPADFRLG